MTATGPSDAAGVVEFFAGHLMAGAVFDRTRAVLETVGGCDVRVSKSPGSPGR